MRTVTYHPLGSTSDTRPSAHLIHVENRNNISFTGNAIEHITITGIQKVINLKEWIWHEEIINGSKHYIITDKALSTNS